MSNNNPHHPSLPARPLTSSSNPESSSIPFPLPPPTLFANPSLALPSSSSSSNATATAPATPCSICSSPSKYTCPRCDLPTCSAECSKSHKAKFACSGERDPSKFVDLKSYSQGTWGDDFRYLEESRRKILGWGEGLPRDSLSALASHGTGQAAGRGGRGGGAGGGQAQLSNAERRVGAWKRQMQKLGCWVDTMPEGMSRRKENSSGWNPRSQTLHLTVHLSIPPDLLTPPESPRTSIPPSTSTPVIVKHQRITFSSPSHPSPSLASLLPPTFVTGQIPSVVFLLPFHPSPSRPTPTLAGPRRPKLYFPPLDPNMPLNQVLRGTSFIEFPIVHIMKSHTWIVLKAKGDMQVVEKADVGPYLPPSSTAPVAGKGKGRLVQEVKTGIDAAAALGGLADYASDDDEDFEDALDEDGGEAGAETALVEDGMDEVREDGEGGEEREEDVAGLLGAIEIPGGPEMMQRVSEALLADFGGTEVPEDAEVVMQEVETRR